jgi:hypothetical protein
VEGSVERLAAGDGVDVEHPASALADAADGVHVRLGMDCLEALRIDDRCSLTLEAEPVPCGERVLDRRDARGLLRMGAGVVSERRRML